MLDNKAERRSPVARAATMRGGLPLTSFTSVTNLYCVTEMFILLALLACYVNKRSSYSMFFGQPHLSFPTSFRLFINP